MISVIAVALSAATMAASAQSTPTSERLQMAAPAASDPATRDSVAAAVVKAAPAEAPRRDIVMSPSNATTSALAASPGAQLMRATAPTRP
jgi:hypothetical protein